MAAPREVFGRLVGVKSSASDARVVSCHGLDGGDVSLPLLTARPVDGVAERVIGGHSIEPYQVPSDGDLRVRCRRRRSVQMTAC